MKILKYILFIILGLLAVYLVLCAMGPKKFELKKSMSMNASPEAVFEEVGDFSRWNKWSPWHQMDPNMKSTITGTPNTKGHMQVWQSEVVGGGSQEFVELRPNAYIKSEMKFTDFGDEASYAEFILEPKGDSTNVTWTMDGSEIAFMFRGLMVVMGATTSMEKDYEKGLSQIKAIAEAKPKPVAFAYDMTTIADTWYVGELHAGLSMQADISPVFGKSFAKIGEAIGGMDKMTGHPFCIGRKVDYTNGIMDLETALPIASEIKVKDGLTCAMIAGGRAAQYVYYGPYEGTAEAWGKFMAAIEKDGLKPRFDGYEVYTNDPEIVKDPAKFETLLIQPVE